MSTLPPFEFATAKNRDQALQQLSSDWNSAALYAGGMDLLDLMKERLYTPQRLVNIKNLQDMRSMSAEQDGSVRIGALATLHQVAADEIVAAKFPAVALACGEAATPQVRNVATIGGNLCQRPRCWYFRNEDFHCLKKGGQKCFAREGENKYHAIFTTDEPCVIIHPSSAAIGLMALDAQLKIIGRAGERVLPLAEFFVRPKDNIQRENVLKPTELITEVLIPATMAGWQSFYLKQKEKQSFDWPLVDVAVAVKLTGDRVEDSRVVLGSTAPVPRRATETEKYLKGKSFSGETIARAAALAADGAAPLAQNGYKVQLVKVITRRALLGAAQVKVS